MRSIGHHTLKTALNVCCCNDSISTMHSYMHKQYTQAGCESADKRHCSRACLLCLPLFISCSNRAAA